MKLKKFDLDREYRFWFLRSNVSTEYKILVSGISFYGGPDYINVFNKYSSVSICLII